MCQIIYSYCVLPKGVWQNSIPEDYINAERHINWPNSDHKSQRWQWNKHSAGRTSRMYPLSFDIQSIQNRYSNKLSKIVGKELFETVNTLPLSRWYRHLYRHYRRSTSLQSGWSKKTIWTRNDKTKTKHRVISKERKEIWRLIQICLPGNLNK